MRYKPLDRNAINHLPDLSLVTNHRTGLNNIDLNDGEKCSIIVANSPGSNPNAIAKFMISHLLNDNRHLVELATTVSER